MKVYWELSCDFGHHWEEFAEENANVSMQCPEGHEAVVCAKHAPVDHVSVTIRPAGRVSDIVTARLAFEKKYWVIVSNLQDTWTYQMKSMYSWREAEEVVRLFEGCSEARAKAIIASKRL